MDNQRACGCRSKQLSVELGSERREGLRMGGPGDFVLKLSAVFWMGNVSRQLLCWMELSVSKSRKQFVTWGWSPIAWPCILFSLYGSCVSVHWVQPDSGSCHTFVVLSYFPFQEGLCMSGTNTNPFTPSCFSLCIFMAETKEKPISSLTLVSNLQQKKKKRQNF